ncbi:YceI family protein [Candidatus Albibeggiatoa sp. nov. BB20]|uniref:YceI family protein n=1 Tax=Candidatus Albibeggiatoa sp. nov. BB20 TaxID=3162723 RepID=UPI003365824D
MKKLLAIGLLASLSWSTQADWILNNADTAVSFVTIKSNHIAEVSRFKQVEGIINAQGNAEIKIDLSSVDTLIPIRDERMQAHLFETETYSHATIKAQLDVAKLDQLAAGQMMSLELVGQLNLHGEDQAVQTTVTVSRLSDTQLLVASQKPIVVDAQKYKLADGVNTLREIAGLSSISYAVPVNFVLSFNNQ